MGIKIISESVSFLTFCIGSGLYGINISKIQNIIEMSRITVVQGKGNLIVGYFNLRGTSIKVADTRVKLGIQQSAYTDSTCVLLVEIGPQENKMLAGLIVDLLQEVIEISPSSVFPESFDNLCNYGIIGTYKLSERNHLNIIEPDCIFTTNEIELLKV